MIPGRRAIAWLSMIVAPVAGVGPPNSPSIGHWRPCDGSFQCATARVPLDYRHPHGPKISIAVIRHRATGRRIGSLFFNSGGPHAQVEDFPGVYRTLPAAVRTRFDVLTFDPRGFGRSTAVQCFATAADEGKFLAGLPAFPVGARQQSAWVRRFARFDALCARRQTGVLDHDTTADGARDLELLRRAVGDRRLNYLGESYGTGLGATYANLFPGRTGRIVLDASLDPVAWTRGHGILPTSLRLHTDQGSAATMRAFLRLCGLVPVARCAFSAGSPAATGAKFWALLSRLRRQPVTADGQAFSYATTIASLPLDKVSEWADGASLLQQLWIGSRRAEPAAAAYPGLEQQLAVICADSPDPRDPRAYAAAARLAYARSGGFGLASTWLAEPCARWPAKAGQDRYAGPWNRPTASPIMLLANTGDPALPYRDSVAMARDLARARLLTIVGNGHTEAGNPSRCAVSYEVRYLVSGDLPPAGTRCSQDSAPFTGRSG